MVVTKSLSIYSLLLIFLIRTLLVVRLKSKATLTKENPVIRVSYPLVNTGVNDARLV